MINKTVLIIDKKSSFYGKRGCILSQGNNDYWQIEIIKKCGIYFKRNQFIIIEKE